MHLQKIILQKKKSYFDEGLDKNRNKPKFLVHLVYVRKKQVNQRWYISIQSTGKCKYFQKFLLWISQRSLRKTTKGTQQIY